MPRNRSKIVRGRTTRKRKPRPVVNPTRVTALTDISLDAVVSIDATGVVTEWNPAAERIFGFTQEEMIGKLLHQHVMHPADAKRHVAALKNLAEGGAPRLLNQRIELRGMRKGGAPVDVELAITQSGPDHYTGFIRDITEAKREQQKLLRRDEFLVALLRNASDAVHIVDAEGKIIYSNEAVKRMVGWEVDEMVGKIGHDFVHPDDLPGLFEGMQYVAENPGVPRTQVMRVKHKTQGWRWLECVASNHVADPVIGGIIVNFRDITERYAQEQALRDAEERYRKLVHYSGDAVLMGDAQGRTLFASPAIERITGYTPDEIKALDISSLIHPEDAERAAALRQQALAEPGRGIDGVIRLRHKLGHWVWVQNIATNWLNEPGINALVTNMRDISDRIGLEQQLMHADRLDAVGRLAGGVAHDFNNILSVIIGYAQVVLDGLPQDAPLRSDITEIRDAGERAAALTRQLLAFSRKQVLQTVVLDVNQVVSRMDRMLQRLIGEDVRLVTLLDRSVGRTRADPGQLEQIIVNLAVNARDAMPQGGKLTIETGMAELDQTYVAEHPGAHPGAHVYIAISDTGVGMDAATREKIFEPFFTTKAMGRGTGLGLSTVYGIVKQSGGAIWVYSEPGRGTTFKIYLPEVPDPSAAPRAATGVSSTRGSETLLVVEDEPGVHRLLTQVLAGAGYNVLMAEGGEEAIRLFEANPGIALLLTDVVLPGMGGPAIARALQARSARLKVLYMSGYTDNAIVHHGVLDAGVNFIEKPLRPEGLLIKIRSILDEPTGRKA